MAFSSVQFLFVFLPLALAVYWLCPKRLRNAVLGAFSLLFFAWAGLKGAARLSPDFLAASPLALAEAARPEELARVHWYLACGDRDPLLSGTLELHHLLRAKGTPAALRVGPGGRSWSSWRSGLGPALAFLGASFRGD